MHSIKTSTIVHKISVTASDAGKMGKIVKNLVSHYCGVLRVC